MDLAARRGLSLVLLDLEPLDALEDFDSMQAHFYAKVVLQVYLSDVFNDLTVDPDLLYIHIGWLIGVFPESNLRKVSQYCGSLRMSLSHIDTS